VRERPPAERTLPPRLCKRRGLPARRGHALRRRLLCPGNLSGHGGLTAPAGPRAIGAPRGGPRNAPPPPPRRDGGGSPYRRISTAPLVLGVALAAAAPAWMTSFGGSMCITASATIAF